ncbi:Crp/Fnr family transcriptional regulator [Fibrobacter sp.]|uniref:Crp/Fnr family transcriptional regulator n=1 Tax=Fibrobacter sp. TaxID=35828 RepID=UPI003890E3B2
MITGDSRQPVRQQVIPPTHQSVKAGFVVYSPGSEERNIVILEEGELTARETTPPYSIVFTMRPGDLVGVAALLEREPFKYELSATKDSKITLVTEDCMESELKRLPLWLLALIRSISAKTHQLKRSAVETRVQNTLLSLAEYLSHKTEKKDFNLAELIREFSFLTKIPTSTVEEDLKSLLRRHLIKLSVKNKRIFCQTIDAELLHIYTDYLHNNDNGASFVPYKLTLELKQILVYLSTEDESISKNGPDWIQFIQQRFPKAAVTQWINLLKLGWFSEEKSKPDHFHINKAKVLYFLKALRYETNIRGVL